MKRAAALVLLSTIAPTGTIAATESAPRGVGPECKWKLPMLFTHTHLDGQPEMVLNFQFTKWMELMGYHHLQH